MKLKIFTICILAMLTITACQKEESKKLSELSLIPLPVTLEDGEGFFELTNGMTISINQEDESLSKVAKYLADLLSPATGFDFEIKNEANPTSGIVLVLKDNTDWSDEEYSLDIGIDKITITANLPQGLFRGIQTLRQALPAAIEKSTKQSASWKIPMGKIQDKPAYGHRGAMLDVARHFFSVDDVKRYIDFIAAYKMNILHLHLSDDQGWRIEIKSYPKLTTHGGKTEVGGGKGGFYTQEQYTDIVNYAAERFITVIPEIDMPGHTNAALASYPELNCDGKAPELYTGIEVGFSTLCVRKAETWAFVDSVVRELAALTPGGYIHIGGDESNATEKGDYIFFVDKAQEIVNKYGKQMIGWDEVATANFKPNSVAQYWAKARKRQTCHRKRWKTDYARRAQKTYMDMQYDYYSHPFALDALYRSGIGVYLGIGNHRRRRWQMGYFRNRSTVLVRNHRKHG